jgi:ADP-heptose:LPS heptosyltransferase
MLAGTRPETIPAPIPYLRADPARVAVWRRRLDTLVPRGHRRIGLIWAGNTAHTGDRERSTTLATLLRLAARPATALLSLQQGPARTQVARHVGGAPLINLAPELHGFADTMAVLEAIDLLISVDTGVVHLAGAMGRPAWVLLPYAPDWRWLLGRNDTPWYPTLRLFRQPAPEDWASAVAAAVAALDEA